MKRDFNNNLNHGKVGESVVAKMFLEKGLQVLPVYDVQGNENKGPRLYVNSGNLIAPDMLVFNNTSGCMWVEAKRKYSWTWHRNSQKHVTGIDYHHFRQYQKVKQATSRKLWLMFAMDGGPDELGNPTKHGIWGGEISTLAENYNHAYGGSKYGKGGMIYWNMEQLNLFDERYPSNLEL